MSILSVALLNIRLEMERILPDQPCLLCGAPSRQRAWCDACDAALPYLSPAHCPQCALPTHDGAVCGHCLQRPPQFDRTVAAFAYSFPVDKLVQALKFNEQLTLARSLAESMVPLIKAHPSCIIPMPLHPARLRERGFNQSLELSRYLARHLDIPLLPTVTQRVRDTSPQSGLPWKERKKNLKQAFACGSEVAGLHVAIVDDVMTTGASLNELAKTLKAAGACEVSAWVVARTLPHSR